jgi:hypothetical protein
MRAKWTLRTGLVVRRESIPLSLLQDLGPDRFGIGNIGQRDERSCIVPVSDDVAMFAAPRWLSPFDEAAVVNKGSVAIKGDNVEIVYRASVGATVVLAVWFGLLFVWVGVVLYWAKEPFIPVLIGLGLMSVVALIVRHAIRVQIRILRGIAAEAAMSLRKGRKAHLEP